MKFSVAIQLAAIFALVAAHPGGHKRMAANELHKRQIAARERNILARNCAPAIAEFQASRKARRSLKKRQDAVASSTASAASPHVTSIQNFTCVTAPEVTEGPYYINNELVRADLTETQPGVKLILDIGVIDVTTCEPLNDAFVEIWSANSTGVYGGYAATLSGGPPGGAPGGTPPSGTDAPPSSTDDGTAPSGTPSGTPPDGGAGGPGGVSSPLERNETFCRGGLATNANGIVELTTIYPGYYEGRTAHIHTMVHLNWEKSENGTLISHAGSLLHIGQFFFDESWNDQVYSVFPYTTDTNNRTLNVDDSILAEENADGNNAFIELELLGDDVSDGLLGFVTMGVNSSVAYSIMNTNYLNSTGSA